MCMQLPLHATDPFHFRGGRQVHLPRCAWLVQILSHCCTALVTEATTMDQQTYAVRLSFADGTTTIGQFVLGTAVTEYFSQDGKTYSRCRCPLTLYYADRELHATAGDYFAALQG